MSGFMSFGDRRDGRRVRTLPAMSVVSPYIMDLRCDSQNYLIDSVKINEVEKYLNQKRADGYKGMSLMHVIIAAYIRTVAQMPAINRFIAGQRVYSRPDIIVSLVIKREMSLESPDTAIKVRFSPDATIEDVYNKFNETIESYRENPGGDFDKIAGILNAMPGLILRSTIRFLRFLDYFGVMPSIIEKISPFHSSMFITSMGSLGIPPIYHHLYNFGNVPLFISFGAKKRVNELADDGSVEKNSYMDITFVMDERICDGYYFAAAYKYMKKYFKNPELLDSVPEKVLCDIK